MAAQPAFTLYDLLEVAKEASQQAIKKQYKVLVLRYHPDKNTDDPLAREKFQKLKEAYDILSNTGKRKEYDETGRFGQDFDQQSFQTAYDYFRTIYKPITEEDINHFAEKYRNRKSEQEDLLAFYDRHGGNMTTILQEIPLSRNEDQPRFLDFFEAQIKKNVIKRTALYTKTLKKVRPVLDETKEFEKEAKKNGQKPMSELVLAIKNKGGDFLASLEAKYCVGKPKKAVKPQVSPPKLNNKARRNLK